MARGIAMRERKGFTLIELLVVVSIIALLVSILLPALNKARKQTRRVTCATQLRQCGVSMYLYATQDGKDHLPPRHMDFELRYLLYDPYYKILAATTDDVHIFVCPGFRNSYFASMNVTWCPEPERNRIYRMEPHPAEWNNGQGMYLGYSYMGGKDQSSWGWTTLLGAGTNIRQWRSPLRITERPELPLMADHIELNGNYVEATHRKNGWKRAWYYWLEPKDFEVEGGNVLTLDGSVHWKNVDQLEKHPRSNYVGAYNYW